MVFFSSACHPTTDDANFDGENGTLLTSSSVG